MVDDWVSHSLSVVSVSDVSLSLKLRIGDDGSLDDMDGISDSSVSGGHFSVELGDGSAEGDISIFFVHVDNSGSGSISDNNSVILHRKSLLLEDLLDGEDLTGGSLNLLCLHEVPESGLGEGGVGMENSHSVVDWGWISFSWTSSSSNEELSDLKLRLEHYYSIQDLLEFAWLLRRHL